MTDTSNPGGGAAGHSSSGAPQGAPGAPQSPTAENPSRPGHQAPDGAQSPPGAPVAPDGAQPGAQPAADPAPSRSAIQREVMAAMHAEGIDPTIDRAGYKARVDRKLAEAEGRTLGEPNAAQQTYGDPNAPADSYQDLYLASCTPASEQDIDRAFDAAFYRAPDRVREAWDAGQTAEVKEVLRDLQLPSWSAKNLFDAVIEGSKRTEPLSDSERETMRHQTMVQLRRAWGDPSASDEENTQAVMAQLDQIEQMMVRRLGPERAQDWLDLAQTNGLHLNPVALMALRDALVAGGGL